MEFLLLWWDELDDLSHACRHVATSAFTEVADRAAPLAAAGLAAIAAAVSTFTGRGFDA